jgi:hypothetical protein
MLRRGRGRFGGKWWEKVIQAAQLAMALRETVETVK